MKNSNDTKGNQTRDFPACSTVPQPTAPPRVPVSEVNEYKMSRERVEMLLFELSDNSRVPLTVTIQ